MLFPYKWIILADSKVSSFFPFWSLPRSVVSSNFSFKRFLLETDFSIFDIFFDVTKCYDEGFLHAFISGCASLHRQPSFYCYLQSEQTHYLLSAFDINILSSTCLRLLPHFPQLSLMQPSEPTYYSSCPSLSPDPIFHTQVRMMMIL